MLFLRILVLVCTALAVQDIHRYYQTTGGIYDYTDFVGRLGQEVGQRVDEKMAYKKADIVPFINQILDWTQKKQNKFRNDKCLILNFG